jgi:glyoxylase-like metal-dependent hydrolase (beta-lactamase superfamily II)
MLDLTISRRTLLGAAAACGAAGALGMPGAAFAKAPPVGTQMPFFYRIKLGDLEATVVSDGPLALGPLAGVYPDAPKEEFEKLLAAHFASPNAVFEQNAIVVNTGDRLVLIDTGVGSAKPFGPNSGRMLQNLAAAGIDPKTIDAVILTHAHPDHCWGCLAADDSPNYPNAQVYMAEADYNFWTDEGKLNHPQIKGMVAGTRKALTPLRERMSFVKDGADVVPGIKAIHTPGHTVGHTSYVVSSGNQSLLVSGDVVHHPAVSMARPKYKFGFDTDPDQGVATRVKTLDMASSERMPVLAYHFPWPGIGHVSKDGDGYRYHAAPMRVVPE